LFFYLSTSSTNKKDIIEYPADIDDIRAVTLKRPIESSNGEAFQIHTLLSAFQQAKRVGPVKCRTDYEVLFQTYYWRVHKLRVCGNNVKGNETDWAIRIPEVEFLNNF
jgi:hypothetical protein